MCVRGDKRRRNPEFLCLIVPYLGASAAGVFSQGPLGLAGCVNTIAIFKVEVQGGSSFTGF